MGGYVRRANEHGSRPDKDRQWSEGYGYANEVQGTNGLTYGYEAGFGLQSGLLGNKDGWNAQSDLLSGYGFLGAQSQQEADGSFSAWHGVGAGGKVADFEAGYGSPGEGWYGRGHAEALSAEAFAKFNPQRGVGGKVGADLVGGDVMLGHLSKDTGHDVTAKVGASFGVGVGGGLHWADEDGDGIREIGVNGSLKLGPGISFDLRSETLGQGYNWAEENVPAAWDASTDWAGDAWDTSTDWVGDAWDTSADAISDGWDATTDFASDTWTGATDMATTGWNATTDAVSTGWNATTDAVGGAWDSSTDAVGGAWDSSTDWVGGAASSVGGAVASFFSGW